VINWLHSYLSGRSQQISLQGHLSTMSQLTARSPQGSILSPLLFLIMVADLENWVSEGSILTYADDTTCYVVHKDADEVWRILQKSAQEVLNFMSASLLAANESKTKFFMFKKRREDSILVGTSKIDESPSEVLLGFTFTKNNDLVNSPRSFRKRFETKNWSFEKTFF